MIGPWSSDFVAGWRSIPYQTENGTVKCGGVFEDRVVGGIEKIIFGVDVDVEEVITKRNVALGLRRYVCIMLFRYSNSLDHVDFYLLPGTFDK